MINRNVRLLHTGLLFCIMGMLYDGDWGVIFYKLVGCAFIVAWLWVDWKGGDDGEEV